MSKILYNTFSAAASLLLYFFDNSFNLINP